MKDTSFRKSLKNSNRDFLTSKIRFVDLYVNRPPAYLIARIGLRFSLTPNHLTWLSFLIGMTGAAVFTMGTRHAFLVAGILIQLSSILDGADGMLARLQDKGSHYGGYLDLFFDRILDYSMFIGISIGLWRYSGEYPLLIAGLLAGGLYMLQVNLFYLIRSYRGAREGGTTGEVRAVLLLLVLIFALLNRLDIYIYMMLITFLLITLIRLGYFLWLGWRDRSADL